MALSYKREAINRRIMRIKNRDFTPSTAKSISSAYSHLLYKRGTEKEGLIKTFAETKSAYEENQIKIFGKVEIEYDINMYRNELKEIVDNPNIQTSLNEFYNYAYETISKNIEYIANIDEELYSTLQDLPKRALVDAIYYASEQSKQSAREGYGSGGSFFDSLEQWLSDHNYINND